MEGISTIELFIIYWQLPEMYKSPVQLVLSLSCSAYAQASRKPTPLIVLPFWGTQLHPQKNRAARFIAAD